MKILSKMLVPLRLTFILAEEVKTKISNFYPFLLGLGVDMSPTAPTTKVLALIRVVWAEVSS